MINAKVSRLNKTLINQKVLTKKRLEIECISIYCHLNSTCLSYHKAVSLVCLSHL